MIATALRNMTSPKYAEKEDEKWGFVSCAPLLLDEKTFLRNLQRLFVGPLAKVVYIPQALAARGEYR